MHYPTAFRVSNRRRLEENGRISVSIRSDLDRSSKDFHWRRTAPPSLVWTSSFRSSCHSIKHSEGWVEAKRENWFIFHLDAAPRRTDSKFRTFWNRKLVLFWDLALDGDWQHCCWKERFELSKCSFYTLRRFGDGFHRKKVAASFNAPQVRYNWKTKCT